MSSGVACTSDSEALSPIAIVGMGCRFPGGANTPAAFWQILLEGRDTVTEIPRDRIDLEPYFDPSSPLHGKFASRAGGYIDQPIGGFDPLFFGIAPREAAYMDPQHRLLLEIAWEALEDAGLVPSEIAGSRTGVFVGIWTSDYETRLCRSIPDLDLHVLINSARYTAAGRLSYAFDFRGPSLSVDTACSSSMVAVHLACESIWSGSANLALAGGVNIILEPFLHVAGFHSGALSADGRCKFGDASASGYVRSEGAGVVVLKPLAQALADNDPIYALIRGTAVNNDGRSSGQLSAPGSETQSEVMRHALRRAGVAPAQLAYMEAHGTGTAVGDPVEVRALATVLGEGRPADQPCLIGSSKTNFGHTESAAGFASLMKAALALKHREIPPSINCETPNPKIPWAELPLRLVQERTAWPQHSGPAYAGANSFGIAGTNAHVVLEEPPRHQKTRPVIEGPCLIPLSAHTPEALRALAQVHLEHAREGSGGTSSIADIGYTAARRRLHHPHRLAIVAESRDELVERLEAFVADESRDGLTTGSVGRDSTCRPVFVFAGSGPQWWAMGRELFATEPVYRGAVEACDALFQPLAGWSLVAELQASEAESRMHRTAVQQPTGFALQVGLYALWRSWGIEPAAIVGHSTGEVAAAYASGVLSLADAVRVIYHRSRLQDSTSGQGAMAAMDIDASEAEALIAEYGGRVSVAAINSPTSVTLSGDVDAIEALIEKLEARGTFARRMRVETAFHSAVMDDLHDELLDSLEGLTLNPASVPTYTTATGGPADADTFGTLHWWSNMRGAVYFARAVGALIGSGYTDFLEVSPHPVLSASIQACLEHAGVAGNVLSSLRRKSPERAQLLGSLGRLYTLGGSVDWARQYPDGHVVSLPPYPWQREHVWFEEDTRVNGRNKRRGMVDRSHPFLGARFESAAQPTAQLWEVDIDLAAFPYLNDHRVGQSPLFPAAAYFDVVLAAAIPLFGRGGCAIQDARLHEGLFLSEAAPRAGQIVIDGDSAGATFQFLSRGEQSEWTLHVSGRLVPATDVEPAYAVDFEQLRAACDTELSASDHYDQVRRRRIEYGPHFQAVRKVWQRPNEALGVLQVADDLESGLGAYQIHPVLLDGAFQLLLSALDAADVAIEPSATYLPAGVRSLRVYQRVGQSSSWGHARLQVPPGSVDPARLIGDIDLRDSEGQLIASVEGLEIQKVERPLADQIGEWLYAPEWLESSPSSEIAARRNGHAPLNGRWLVFADRGQVSDQLALALAEAGARPSFVRDAGRECPGAGECVVAPGDAFAMHALLESLSGDDDPIAGVIYAWGASDADAGHDASFVRGPIGLLHLIQAMAGLERPLAAPVWILTRGAVPVEDAPRIELAPLWGLANVVAMEHPELNCRCVDLGDGPPDEIAAFVDELWSNTGEAHVALRGGRRFVARLARVSLEPPAITESAVDTPFQIDIDTSGIAFTAARPRRPGVGEVEVQVYAAGLPGERRLGFDCAGRVVAVGEGVWHVRAGDRVVGFAQGPIASFITTDARLVHEMPDGLGYTAAAALPQPLATGILALRNLAQMSPGEHLRFVHAGPTRGANTTPTPDLSYLAVDIETLAAEQPEHAGRLLREAIDEVINGRLDVPAARVFSAADVGNALQASDAGELVVLDLHEQSVPLSSAAIRGDGSYLISGGLGGLGLGVAEDLVDQGARSLVLLGRGEPSAQAQAQINAMRRAGVSVCAMRCDVSDRESVARVMAELRALDLPPLRGVVHAAGVLDDGLLQQQSRERFDRVAAPKIAGAWNLHTETLDCSTALDFFVMFSSAAVVVGNPGQGNYVAANAFMDALAHARRAQGLPALSINWGAWSEVGLAAAHAVRGERLATQGLTSLSPRQGLAAFRALLATEQPQVAVMPFDVRRWCQSHPAAGQWSFLATLLAQAQAEATESIAQPDNAQVSIQDLLRTAGPTEWHAVLEGFVVEQVARVLKMPPGRVDRQAPMKTLGFDSLMSLELRSRVESGLGLSVSPTLAFNYPTVYALTDYLAERLDLNGTASTTAPDEPADDGDDLLAQILESAAVLSAAELDTLVSGAAE